MENYYHKVKQSIEHKLIADEHGASPFGLAVAIVATPVCAVAGAYLGTGIGWLWGNIVDVIPLVKDVAPYIAENIAGVSSKVANDPDFNEDVRQIMGAVGGFWAGAFLPLKILLYEPNP